MGESDKRKVWFGLAELVSFPTRKWLSVEYMEGHYVPRRSFKPVGLFNPGGTLYPS